MRIQREGAQLQIRGTWSAGSGDDQARFLADLRALRDSAVIGYDELAGPGALPERRPEGSRERPFAARPAHSQRLCPRLRRGCPGLGRTVAAPQPRGARRPGSPGQARRGERGRRGGRPRRGWRRAARCLRSGPDPGRAPRWPGTHGTGQPQGRRSWPADSGRGQPGLGPARGAEHEPGSRGRRGAGPGWDAVPDPHVTAANGHDSAEQVNRGPFDAAFTTADQAGDVQAEEDFSWLQQGPPQSSPAENEPSSWSSPVENEPSSWSSPADHEPSSWSARTDSPLVPLPEAGSVAPEPDSTERIPRYQAERLVAQERTDFWSKPPASSPAPSVAAPSVAAPSAPADLRAPSPSHAEEPAITRASWPSTAEPAAAPAAETAQRVPAAARTTAAGTATSSGTAQQVSPQGPPGQPATPAARTGTSRSAS